MAALVSADTCARQHEPETSLDDVDDVDAPDDAYDDLEQWYATSLPHLQSSASFAHMTNAFTTRHRPTRSDSAHTATEDSIDDLLDDYAIDLDAEESRSLEASTPVQTPTPLHEASLNEASLDDSAFLHFVPKKLRTPQDAAERGTAAAAIARCCDTCHSDLHGKLLVNCQACGFRRHFYCFSPPRREHPALTDLHRVPRHKRKPMATLIKQWRCDACVTRLGGRSPALPDSRCKPQPSPQRPIKKKEKTAHPIIKPPHEPSALRADAFDWHAFRADKHAKVIKAEDQLREEDHDHPVRNELVLYSPTNALLRKTARFWQQHVTRRRQLRAQSIARLAKCQPPLRREALQVELSPRETAEVAAATHRRQQQEDELERLLFDDAARYPWHDPRPVFETLRWRPPPVTVVDDCSAESEEEHRGREAREREFMEQEDDDALTPAQAQRLARRRALAVAAATDPRLLGLCLAARMIERVVVRWLGATRRRSRERIEEEEAAAATRTREEEETKRMEMEEYAARARRERAQRLIQQLGYLLAFVLALVRAQRRVEMKKQLVTVLMDAKEDSDLQAESFCREDQIQQLARRRLERFFCRRVRRYIMLKHRVMVRRLVRWWRHRHYTYLFRTVATTARMQRRKQAACCIQRAFRSYRVFRTFQSLREKLRVRRVQQFLRGWLLRRLAHKERDRMAVFDAAVAISGRVDLVAEDAPVHEILQALGLVLYEQSDFWNASAVLCRVAALDSEATFALAYSHHQSWHSSCDPYQLAQAEDGYRKVITDTQSSGHPVDPFLVQELAIVLMHREATATSLALLAKLIELFANDDGFPLWLLLAGIQLAHVEQYDQSVEYLGYVVDLALPSPYTERDVLALCAMSYEKTTRGNDNAKEAWRAAVRLWTVEKKVSGSPASVVAPSKTRLGVLRKWELLVDLAARSSDAGHYLVVCHVLLHALERLAPRVINGDAAFEIEKRQAWWRLGDAFRHLGRLDQYVEATARSQETTGEDDNDERMQWRAQAEIQTQRFQHELKTLSPVALVSGIQKQYEVSGADDWALEDVVAE